MKKKSRSENAEKSGPAVGEVGPREIVKEICMITIFSADTRQNNKNCFYPHRFEVTDEASLKQAVSKDYVCAEFRANRRNIGNFVSCDCLAFDVDNDHSDQPVDWILPEDVAAFFTGVTFWVHYSRSNRKEKNGKAARPKFHVLFPIRECGSAEQCAALKQSVQRIFPYFDAQALDAARFFFGTENPEVEYWQGVRNLSDFLENRGVILRGEPEAVARKETSAYAPGATSEQKGDVAAAGWGEGLPGFENNTLYNPPPAGRGDRHLVTVGEVRETEPQRDRETDEVELPIANLVPILRGERNTTMHRFAVKCLKRYGICERAYELFRREARRCEPPLEEEELCSVWQSAAKYYRNAIAVSASYVQPEQYGKAAESLKPPDYSDIGQAKVVVREYGNELCYTDNTDFLRYDGCKWNESHQLAVGAMEEFLDLQLADAEDEIAEAAWELNAVGGVEFDLSAGLKGLDRQIRELNPEEEKLKALLNAEAKLQAAYTYKAFVMRRRDMSYLLSALAAAKPMVQKNISDLDKDEFLLNTPDATYDLRYGMSGALAHEPENYITKITWCSPSAKGMELWQKALETFFQGDAELIDYVQQIAGLAAIGKVFMEAIIISYGEGRNGKSTFWNTVARVMGSYSGQISADALTVGCKRNVKPEMAELKGKRLVIAAELEEGMRLNTSVIKQLCSTDEIFAEKKYRDPFRFVPSHTLVLYTNHLPRVGASDAGTWRRLIVIPFNAKIEGTSDIRNYTDYLVQNAGEAVLQWIIEGAQKVIANHFVLPVPACVKAAVKAYRDSNDWLGNFLADCCDVNPDYREKSGSVYQEYRDYCMRNGEWARNTADFYAAMDAAGFERHKGKDAMYVYGLRLKTAVPVYS